MKIDYYKNVDSKGIISYTAEVRNHWWYWLKIIVISLIIIGYSLIFIDKLGFFESKPAPTIQYKAPGLKDRKPKPVEPTSRDYEGTELHLT